MNAVAKTTWDAGTLYLVPSRNDHFRVTPLDGFASSEYSAAFFFRAPVPISYVEPDGKFRAVNDAWCKLTGYSEVELLGMTFQEITHPQDIEPDSDMVAKMLLDQRRTSYQMVKRYITKQGKTVWIELHVVSVWKDNAFDHFVSWAIPLPNHGAFKVAQIGNEVHVRPMLKLKDFFFDNWKILIPMIGATLVFLWKFVSIVDRIMQKTGVQW